ncbi:hypothetical protein BDV96DRAFT_644174 [Lophiotrema nucula]|uniref:Uncharacterized protein n=1 Tax=Lophiotrema nucula TaxID=690887 RepID=A0A6A5ZF12_9PLEO|nr:hypothetical protein BDV96DRAFT_644174 [Lophiotrema nucula]
MYRVPRITAKDQKFATVIVGPEKERFVVHEQLLTFDRTSSAQRLRESSRRDKRRFFNSEDPEDIVKLWSGYDGDTDNIEGDPETEHYGHLYVFADKYQVPRLKRQTLNEFFDHGHEQFWEEEAPFKAGVVFQSGEHQVSHVCIHTAHQDGGG